MSHRRKPPPARHAERSSESLRAVLRRTEAELLSSRSALRAAESAKDLAEQRFRGVFRQQFQFMVILSPEGRVIDYSQQLPLEDGAMPADQVVGRLFWDTIWWQHTPRMRTQWPERLRQAALASGPVLTEDEFSSPTGESRVASAAITALRDARGELDCFVVQGTDITERKRADERRALLEAKLRETHKMQAVGTLAGGIAHDFNNILGSILGNLVLAQNDAAADHPVQPRLEQIRKAASRARNLVRRVLAFSRHQPNELIAQPLRPILDETLELLRSTLPPGASLVTRLSDVPLWVHADATQLQRVVMNLCANAGHALVRGTGRIEVGLAPAAQPPDSMTGEWAHFWVRDDGIGMDESIRERIFEPFFTTRERGEGTGLGLSVVHGIVGEHGGVLTVETAPGRGSCFDIALPIAESAEAREPEAAGELIAARPGPSRQVLYVDDDPVMGVMVHALLQRAGFRVTTCADAATAIALLRSAPSRFDIVVTDFNMPHGTGLEVARAAQALRSDLPVVISSGYLNDELRKAAEQAGVRRLVSKEDSADELVLTLNEVLAG